MDKHKRNYIEANKVGEQEKILCEACNMDYAVDIHHIKYRSRYFKEDRDQDNNLIALCRDCHNMAHDEEIKPEELQKIADHRIIQRELGNYRGFEYQFKSKNIE